MPDPFNRDVTVEYGRAVPIAPQVRRLTAPNPSPMTFTGTQTYLVGSGDVMVIDPGPDLPAQTDAILQALGPGEHIGAILVTHTHIDHSPGARSLKAATGAPIHGFGRHGAGESPTMAALTASGASFGGGEGADHDLVPDHLLADGDVVESGGTALTALHTPGHLSNHLCFALPGGAVFSGDLIMGWATTMVSPPDGDMAAFMASLERMAGHEAHVFYPGHGHAVTDPRGMIAHQAAHRRGREAQIVAALAKAGEATPAALTAGIYHDVDPALHGAAARNVFAHLLGLVSEGRAEAVGPISPQAAFRLI